MIKFHLLNRCSHGIHNSAISGQLGCCSAVVRQGDGVVKPFSEKGVIVKESLSCILLLTGIHMYHSNSKMKQSQEIEMERLV